FTIETRVAEPATSRWKRSVTVRLASTPGGSTQRSIVRCFTSPRYDCTAGDFRHDVLDSTAVPVPPGVFPASSPSPIAVSTETTSAPSGDPTTSRFESTPSFTELPLPLPIWIGAVPIVVPAAAASTRRGPTDGPTGPCTVVGPRTARPAP